MRIEEYYIVKFCKFNNLTKFNKDRNFKSMRFASCKLELMTINICINNI